MSVTCFGQETQSIDSIQTTEADSIHAGSHTFSDTKLEDVTKAEGDSAYIKADSCWEWPVARDANRYRMTDDEEAYLEK